MKSFLRKYGLVIALLVALPTVTKAASSLIKFETIVNKDVGGDCSKQGACPIPVAIGVGSFNSNTDSIKDLAVVNVGADNVAILLGDGLGNFSSPADPDDKLEVGRKPTSIAVARFNNDTFDDLAVVSFGDPDSDPPTAGDLRIFLGQGDGTFTALAPITFPVDAGPLFVVAADFDGDGFQDLAVANHGADPTPIGTTVSIYLGNGDGTFTRKDCDTVAGGIQDCSVGQQPVSIAVGDFDGDSKLDLAVANFFDSTITILKGDGTGLFTEISSCDGTHQQCPALNLPVTILAADVDGDTKPDLIVATALNKLVQVYRNTGNSLAPFPETPEKYVLSKTPVDLAFGDVNGDGVSDLVAPGFPGTQFSVLLGNGSGTAGQGDGTFQKKQQFKTTVKKATGIFSLSVADLTGDGKNDIAVANNFVSILKNDSTFPGSTTPITVTPLGTPWTAATPQTVTWNPGSWDTTTKGTVTIKFSGDNGLTFTTLGKNVLNSLGTANINAPGATATAIIRVCSVQYPGICGDSGTFVINP